MPIDLASLPPAEAIGYLERKGYRIGFDWRDTYGIQHAAAFTVAKVAELDLLADIRSHLDRALREGRTLRDFTADLRPELQRRGWWGTAFQTDPLTGETRQVQLGSARRLRIIYDTNLRMAHEAGRWERIEATAEERPWLRYVHTPSAHERPEHAALHGIVLRYDDPFWDLWYPKNGWGCKCSVQQLSDRDLARYGYRPSTAPIIPTRQWRNPRTGEVRRVPRGIDPGFDYHVGKAGRGFDPSRGGGFAPAMQGAQDYRSYGRPRAVDIPAARRPAAPPRWETARQLEGRGEDGHAIMLDRFRRLFGIRPGRQEGLVRDPQGVQVAFNEGLLRYVLSKGEGREAFLPLARATVETPWEVWLVPWRKPDGRVTLRKRYIGLFREPSETGRSREVLAVVERHKEGWGIWNSLPKSGIDSQRQGYLIYSRDL